MSITRAQVLVKILRSHISPFDKVGFLKQCSDVFNFAHAPAPHSDPSWDAFKGAEVLESLLIIGSTLNLRDAETIALLEAVLMQLKALCLSPITTALLCSEPQMNAALLNQVPQIVTSFHDALRASRIPDDAHAASIRESALTIVGALLKVSASKEDESFRQFLNKDDILNILFETYVMSEPSPDAIPLPYGTTILAFYFEDRHVDNERMERVLEPHTTETIIRRSLDLFKIEALGADSMLVGAIHFLLAVSQSQRMRRPLVEGGVHMYMIQRYWGWIASKKHSEEDMCMCARAIAIATKSLLRALGRDEHIELKARMIREMVRQAEFVLLLGRTLLSKTSFASVSGAVCHIGHCIAEAFSDDADFMNTEMKQAYMHCYRCLEDFMYSAPHKQDDQKGRTSLYEHEKEQPDFTPAIQGWKEFGKELGFDHDKFVAEEIERKKKEMGGLEGCSWFKCCLYRDTKIAPLREMMRCSGCKAVQYCGTRCQKLDWKEGGHKQECNRLRNK